MGEGVEVDPLGGDRHRMGAGVRRDHDRVGEERRRRSAGGELRGELAEHQVLRLRLDQAERGRVPEQRGAAVAEHDLPIVGQAEQGGDAVAQPAHHVFHHRLAVRRSHVVGGGRRQRVDGFGADLRGSGTETAVLGQKIGRNRD